MQNNIITKIAAVLSSFFLVATPLMSVNAESVSNTNFLNGTVNQTSSGQIIINSITQTKSVGTSDGTFANGWAWTIDVTVPFNEQNLMMKFDNWLNTSNSNFIIPAGGNIRFYSPQSSNAFNENTAIYINAPNTYSSPSMFLVSNLNNSSASRHIQIFVQVRIPNGTQPGTYTSNFGIKTQ